MGVLFSVKGSCQYTWQIFFFFPPDNENLLFAERGKQTHVCWLGMESSIIAGILCLGNQPGFATRPHEAVRKPGACQTLLGSSPFCLER